MSYVTFSRALSRLPNLETLVGDSIEYLNIGQCLRLRQKHAVLGWGFRPSTRLPRAVSRRFGIPFIGLEDGFLRSYAPGRQYPSVSLVVDRQGIYYAADRPSDLETLLESDCDVLKGVGADYAMAKRRMISEGLSKYNHAPENTAYFQNDGRPRILVVDQTVGDASVRYGMADADTFHQMVETARRDNPDATLYIKTHPEVSNGGKRGYLSNLQPNKHTVLLREAASPTSLLRHVQKVYAVSSQLGFEALLHGLPVHCFGMPWYAGWGATQDALQCSRRTRHRTVDELFAAAYLHYSRYINPATGTRGTIFDAMDWLGHQRRMHTANSGRTIAIGYRRWKAENVRPFLRSNGREPFFVPDVAAAAGLAPTSEDRLVLWGADTPEAAKNLATQSGAQLIRMEDGFIRSVGLGSDFVPPSALVLDSRGLYFDPRQPSDLEHLLNEHAFTDEERKRAREIRHLIVSHGLTKYNTEPNIIPSWHDATRHAVLVPGQVEDDASIRHGCRGVRTNLQLLQAARAARPDSLIVYKPHPDVMANNRIGEVHRQQALQYANVIETRASIVSCIDAVQEIHTMTSLSGFDALLRGKSVTTYGMPFYAGWGLTTDLSPQPRRERLLSLEELIAGSLLLYPTYFDLTLNGFTSCEGTLRALIARRDQHLSQDRSPSAYRRYWLRQWKKVALWLRAGFVVTR